MGALFKKELKNYFLSPIGYIYIAVFLFTGGIFFLGQLSSGVAKFHLIYNPMVTVLTFIVPLLTMRMFAEEKKNGTDKILITSPLSITKIVLAKFFAAAVVVIISVLLTLIYYFILRIFGKPNLGETLVAMLGTILLSLCYISVGMICSSVTDNQIIAAVLTIGAFIGYIFLPNISTKIPELLMNYSVTNTFFSTFARGIIELKSIVLMFTFMTVALLITMIVLQRRKSAK